MVRLCRVLYFVVVSVLHKWPRGRALALTSVRELLAHFDAGDLVITVQCPGRLSSKPPIPTADHGQSPTSGAWFLQMDLDLTHFLSVKQHAHGPVSPVGSKSWQALLLSSILTGWPRTVKMAP